MTEIKRSVYSQDQQNEEESRIHIKYHLNKLGWKFRDLSQDNDIDGEIEVFDSVDKQTSGKFVKVQIKSISGGNIQGDVISYPCPVKFLHFCDVCDIPVILVLYDIEAQEAYFLWVQHYIYNKLDKENSEWRSNKASATVKFSTAVTLSFTNDYFRFKLLDMAYNGTNEISQMRKYSTFQRYYTLIAEDNISTSIAKRVSAKILVETSFATSQDAMRTLIPKINQELLYSEHANTTQFHDLDKPCDVIVMFFYNDIRQVKHGLPFCRTQWISEELVDKPNIISPDEYIDSVGVKWESMHEMFLDFIPDNSMSKAQYLRLAEQSFNSFKIILNDIQKLFIQYEEKEIDFDSLKKYIIRYKLQLNEYFHAFSERGYPPFECTELDRVLLDFISATHDLGIYSIESNRGE